MTLSGNHGKIIRIIFKKVLIPLLVDDPLWDNRTEPTDRQYRVLIPLLVDDPLWELLLYFLAY